MSIKLKINAIVACSENNGIGMKGQLPWELRKEMKYFSRMTTKTDDPSKKNAVIMGRKTWESIPSKYRPLSRRLNVVVSTQAFEHPEKFPGCHPHPSFEEALKEPDLQSKEIETVWIIGGSSIYKAAMDSGLMHRLYITRIMKEFECDTFFPSVALDNYKLVEDPDVPTEEQEEASIKYKYDVYEKI